MNVYVIKKAIVVNALLELETMKLTHVLVKEKNNNERFKRSSKTTSSGNQC